MSTDGKLCDDVAMLICTRNYCHLLKPVFLLGCCLLAGCSHLQTFVCTPQEKTVATEQVTIAAKPLTKEEPAKTFIDTEDLTKEGPAKATRTLEDIITRPPVPGITDEALFLLALYNLRSNTRDASGKAQQFLRRLAKEFAASPWNQLGQPILELIDTTGEQRRQITALKNQNQTLSKESRELHQAIEQLKTLDLELERKSRH